jgi:hypothetical protein
MGQLVVRFSTHIGYKAAQTLYYAVGEQAGDGAPFNVIAPGAPHNVHVHWLAHVPARRLHDFTLRLHGWLDAISGALCPAGTIDIRPIDNTKGLRRYGMPARSRPSARYSPHGGVIGC